MISKPEALKSLCKMQIKTRKKPAHFQNQGTPPPRNTPGCIQSSSRPTPAIRAVLNPVQKHLRPPLHRINSSADLTCWELEARVWFNNIQHLHCNTFLEVGISALFKTAPLHRGTRCENKL